MRIAKLLWLKCNQYYLMEAKDFESIKRNLNIRKDKKVYLEHLVDLTMLTYLMMLKLLLFYAKVINWLI